MAAPQEKLAESLEALRKLQDRGVVAWDEFTDSRKDRPYPVPEVPADGEGGEKQRALEERYLPDAAQQKYGRG